MLAVPVDGSLVQQHVFPRKEGRLDAEEAPFVVVLERGAQLAESVKVGVQPSAAYLVATGAGHDSASESATSGPTSRMLPRSDVHRVRNSSVSR